MHQQNQNFPKNNGNRQHRFYDNYFDVYKLFSLGFLSWLMWSRNRRPVWVLKLMDSSLSVAPIQGCSCFWSSSEPCSHREPFASELPCVPDKNEESWSHPRTWKIRNLCWYSLHIHHFNVNPPLQWFCLQAWESWCQGQRAENLTSRQMDITNQV